MFDISATELLVILLVALVVFGPHRLPELSRKVGGWARQLREAATDLRRGLDDEVSELREPVDEARRIVSDVKRDIVGSVGGVKKEVPNVEALFKPVSGPGPAAQTPAPPPDEEDAADEQPRGVEWVGPVTGAGPTPDDAYSDMRAIDGEGDDEAGSS